MRTIYYIFLMFLVSTQVNGQCSFDPVVQGDIIFCPNQTQGELTCDIQNADAYQWFKRPFSGGSEVAIAGATNFNLTVTDNDILYYFSVDVTISGCTERSPEVLLDQWVFLLPSVETTGDFIFQSGTYLICEGDSMFMTLLPPYDTNITWYRDGAPIPDENETTLEVTEPGSYTVSGAPAICPNYILFLGVDLVVEYNTDPNECDIMSVDENERLNDVRVYPNPAHNFLTLHNQNGLDIKSVVLYDTLGRKVLESTEVTEFIDVSKLTSGIYYVYISTDSGRVTQKIIKE